MQGRGAWPELYMHPKVGSDDGSRGDSAEFQAGRIGVGSRYKSADVPDLC